LVTSIQLKEPTKQTLFEVKNHLENLFGRTMNYDEVIEYLVKTSHIDIPFSRSVRKFGGILGSEGRLIFQKMRQEELSNESR
jgi:hypothetical protein